MGQERRVSQVACSGTCTPLSPPPPGLHQGPRGQDWMSPAWGPKKTGGEPGCQHGTALQRGSLDSSLLSTASLLYTHWTPLLECFSTPPPLRPLLTLRWDHYCSAPLTVLLGSEAQVVSEHGPPVSFTGA